MRVSASAGSLGSKTGRRKKKNVLPKSIEDVYNEVSTVVASNLNPPTGRIILTPRSAEICLKHGVNPEILKIRDIDSFWEAGIDPSIQGMRHEAYVQRRHEIMSMLRKDRKKVMNAEFSQRTQLEEEFGMTPEMILEQQKQQASTALLMEKQRLEKIQARQEKEIEQMISFELNRAKVQQDMETRIAEMKRKDDIRKKQQERRFRLMAEERRLRELQRAAMEEFEEERRKKVAQEMHERDRQIAEDHERKLRQEKKRRQFEEQEKQRKHEEHKAQLAKYFSDEQMQLRQRLESMQDAEKKKQEAIMKRQKELASELRHKREVIEERISRNMEMAHMIEEKRKEDFLDRQAHFESIRADHIRRQEEERQLHRQEMEFQEQRRQVILMQQRREEEKKAESLLEKFELEEIGVQEEQRRRDYELSLTKEKQNLRKQMKLENVERVMRVNEYRRLNTLKKIEDSEGRIKDMVSNRERLKEDRKRAAAAARMQKEGIMKVMDDIRCNATKANKIINKCMNSKGKSVSQVIKSISPNAKSTRKSVSAHGFKRKPAKSKSFDDSGSKTTAELLGLGRTTQSEGNAFNDSGNSGFAGHPETGSGSNGQAGSGLANKDKPAVVYSATTEEPMPYVSPYVQPVVPKRDEDE
jgi:hypothetical protein